MAINEDLTGFIREALNRGLPRDEIRDALSQADWSNEEVQAALRSFAAVDFPIPVPRRRPSLSAREAFEYVVLFGTLYMSAVSLGILLFQFINLAFPDPLWDQAFIDEQIPATIRSSISALLVATPIFLYAARANSRALALAPLKRTSPIRQWLTYLTLAIAGAVLIVDTTILVYNLISGDLAIQFLLRTLTIGGIAGTAFVYFLTGLRRDEKEVEA